MQSLRVKQELRVFDGLLQDENFAYEMAVCLDAAYHAGIGQTAPPFLSPAEETTIYRVSKKEEQTAISLAGFYALECGVGALSAQTNESPIKWIERFATNTVDNNACLLLCRFANATWKAGQPFQGLNRITRHDFTGADLLSADEIKKDAAQIKNTAEKLLASLQPVKEAALPEQMKAIRGLLQDTTYAEAMAAHLNATHVSNSGQEFNIVSTSDNDTVIKTVKAMKIAANLAGFYALECTTNYLATTRGVLPSTLLQDVINKTLPKDDETLFARFANATWKAGQPFRGLDRIKREVFTPFYFLTESDVAKDLVQIRAAAKKVLPLLAERSKT